MQLTTEQKKMFRTEARFIRLANEVGKRNPKLAQHYYEVAKELREAINAK